jgi:ADP-ribosylglycohydrolase
MAESHDTPLQRALRSLDGLSVGDAFGERFFGKPDVVWSRIVAKNLPQAPWNWTDDTAMARVVVTVLRDHHQLPPNLLAKEFAREYTRQPGRGYGAGAAQVLNQVAHGVPWQTASSLAFSGAGSFGNGAAMRAAPIGAYFADDVDAVIEQSTNASEITHFHPDGIAGAIAVALAAAWTAQPRPESTLLGFVLEHLPTGAVRRAVRRANEIPLESKPSVVAKELGNGKKVTALDTVPFCLWMAAGHLGDYETALWYTVGVMGDRDTNCAIVGGILASAPDVVIPIDWLQAREPIPFRASPYKA